MNVESVIYKISSDTHEYVSVDADQTCWLEMGNKLRVYVHGIRIFYILGKPEFTQIGRPNTNVTILNIYIETVTK